MYIRWDAGSIWWRHARRETDLVQAIEDLYGVFEKYPLRPSTEPCSCCHTDEDEQAVRRHPLRDLYPEDRSEFAAVERFLIALWRNHLTSLTYGDTEIIISSVATAVDDMSPYLNAWLDLADSASAAFISLQVVELDLSEVELVAPLRSEVAASR